MATPTIERLEIMDGTGGGPIFSRCVTRGDTVYLCGVVPDPGGDIRAQTRQVLARIDALLAGAGTDKSRLLWAQVWLKDMATYAGMNAEWNAWVDRKNPPVRACVGAALFHPDVLVEIQVTAAR
jgi:enamine deaminase RidA (YjgF/YER057c/UK114 family)